MTKNDKFKNKSQDARRHHEQEKVYSKDNKLNHHHPESAHKSPVGKRK